MENKLRPPQNMRAIEMSPMAPSECNRAHIHVPERYQNPPQNTPSRINPNRNLQPLLTDLDPFQRNE